MWGRRRYRRRSYGYGSRGRTFAPGYRARNFYTVYPRRTQLAGYRYGGRSYGPIRPSRGNFRRSYW